MRLVGRDQVPNDLAETLCQFLVCPVVLEQPRREIERLPSRAVGVGERSELANTATDTSVSVLRVHGHLTEVSCHPRRTLLAYDDYRVCSKCKRAVTGYGFVAALKGLNPKMCTDCGTSTLEKQPCPKEVEEDLKRHGNIPKDGSVSGPRAGDDCLECLIKGVSSKLKALHGSKKIPGVVKALSQLVCVRCGAAHPDPDDPVLLEAAKKASEG